MLEHSHHFGVSSGQSTHGGQNLIVLANAEEPFDQVLEPGEVLQLNVSGKLESLMVCATIDGFPDAPGQLLIDEEEFELARGPFQWYRNGHHRPDDFGSVGGITVENPTDDRVRVMGLVGFTPIDTDQPPDDELTEE